MRIIFLTRQEKLASPGFAYHRDRVIAHIESCEHDVDVKFGRVDQHIMSQFALGVSFFYPFILKKQEFDAPVIGTLNCHPGLLPLQRGVAPNVFAIVNGEPAGTTIHYMVSRVDCGPIVSQWGVGVDAIDTGESLYLKLIAASADLMIETWPLIDKHLRAGLRVPSTDQPEGDYVANTLADFSKMGDLEARFGNEGKEMVDWLRSLTHSGYNNAYIHDDMGKKIYVRVSLSYE